MYLGEIYVLNCECHVERQDYYYYLKKFFFLKISTLQQLFAVCNDDDNNNKISVSDGYMSLSMGKIRNI